MVAQNKAQGISVRNIKRMQGKLPSSGHTGVYTI